jgi:hypothetical protein
MYPGAPNSTALQSTVECFMIWLLVDDMSCNFATWQSDIFLKPIQIPHGHYSLASENMNWEAPYSNLCFTLILSAL